MSSKPINRLQQLMALFAISASGLFSGQVYAEFLGEDIFELSLAELSQLTVTTSSRREESLSSVASSITLLTREQIRLLGIDNLNELFNYIPGMQSQRNDTSSLNQVVSSRGFSATTSPREILFLLDGQRLNNIWSGGLGNTLAYMTLDHVERVEFIRGPGSAIYGSNAMTGVVNIITSSQREVSVAAASNKNFQGSGQWRQNIGDSLWQAYVSGVNDGGEALQLYNHLTGVSEPSRDPYRHREAYVRGQIGALEVKWFLSEQKTERFYTAGLISDKYNLFDSETQTFSVQYVTPLHPMLSLTSTASYSQRQFDIQAEVSPEPFQISIAGTVEERELGGEFVFQYENPNGRNGLLGFEFRQPELTNTDAYTSGVVESYVPQAPTDKETIRGLFAQYQAPLGAAVQLTAGVRYDDYSRIGSHLSPRGGLVWRPSQHHTFKLLYGESFRAPTRDETDVQNSPVISANQDLKPEVAKTLDLVWQYVSNKNYSSVSLYNTEIEDPAIPTRTTPSRRENGPRVTITGVEFEWQQQWLAHWQTRLVASHLFDSASDVNAEAKDTLTASLMYQVARGSVALSANYKGERQDPNGSLQGYTTLDNRTLVKLHLRRQLAADTQVTFTIDNLFSEDYSDMASSAGNVMGAPTRGREYKLGFRWAFPD